MKIGGWRRGVKIGGWRNRGGMVVEEVGERKKREDK